jgi:NitT/TauT family transport system substrate-binding protein
MQLQWTHQAEFAGFYAAEANQYYADEGLAVTLVEGGPDVDNIAPVVNGRAQFSIGSGEQLILARAAGKSLRAVATIYRRSPTVYFSLASSGITRPQDFVGKKIRTPSNMAATLHAMTARVGIAPNQYKEVNLPSDVSLFATGEVPIWGGHINALPLLVQRSGISINLIYPDDYGVHFYGDSILTTDEFIAAHPDTVERFVRATLKGWVFAVENPEKTGALTLRYNPLADVDYNIAQMVAGLPLVNTGEDHIGWMKEEMWAGMVNALVELGVLAQPVDVTQLYTLQFLEEIYK